MKPGTAGLICAGGVLQSFLARLPSALAAVGPVFSSSLRVARRLANSLRAGWATDDARMLEECGLIWVVAPEPNIDTLVEPLRTLNLKQAAIVICNVLRPGGAFPVPGADVATLIAADAGEYLIAGEGDARALNIARKILAADGRRLVALHSGTKSLFLAGLQLSSQLLLPGFAAGIECLRKSGLTRREANQIAGIRGLEALRSFQKGGAKAWKGAARPLQIERGDGKIVSAYASLQALGLAYFESKSKAHKRGGHG